MKGKKKTKKNKLITKDTILAEVLKGLKWKHSRKYSESEEVVAYLIDLPAIERQTRNYNTVRNTENTQ